jgi:hypothetical protein
MTTDIAVESAGGSSTSAGQEPAENRLCVSSQSRRMAPASELISNSSKRPCFIPRKSKTGGALWKLALCREILTVIVETIPVPTSGVQIRVPTSGGAAVEGTRHAHRRPRHYSLHCRPRLRVRSPGSARPDVRSGRTADECDILTKSCRRSCRNDFQQTT